MLNFLYSRHLNIGCNLGKHVGVYYLKPANREKVKSKSWIKLGEFLIFNFGETG